MEINIKDEYLIKGKMILATVTVSELDMMSVYNTDVFKRGLALQFAEAIIDHRLIEFTRTQDPLNMSTIVRMRACLVPDEQVRIIRTLGYDRNI